MVSYLLLPDRLETLPLGRIVPPTLVDTVVDISKTLICCACEENPLSGWTKWAAGGELTEISKCCTRRNETVDEPRQSLTFCRSSFSHRFDLRNGVKLRNCRGDARKSARDLCAKCSHAPPFT
ncbi:hypothetical protein JVU11DRAFT_3009 [Chiua virens]|nr:hypothetical protein JVU11DRAFT_3009 [Chiua virens]